jgi:hypothetical protein
MSIIADRLTILQQAAGRALTRGFGRDSSKLVGSFQSCMTTSDGRVPG